MAELAEELTFIDLSADEVLAALASAQSRGVRGGRVHDYLHSVAAQKAKAERLLTTDENDFDGLLPSGMVEQV